MNKPSNPAEIDSRAHALLRRFYGYEAFRPMQLDIIRAAVAGNDTLVLMPTGGGKSMCYQMPALLTDGLVLVVSPLIALMNDQVTALIANGIPAATVNSTMAEAHNREVMDMAMNGRIKLLYISPERLLADIDRWSSALPITMVAIDEAHCISQWGHDFRPVYTRLAALKERWPSVPIMALTATADRVTRDDIVRQLHLTNPMKFIGSFDRPNIHLDVMMDPGKARRLAIMGQLISEHPDDSGIIYCTSRDATEKLAAELSSRGVRAEAYHAGLPAQVRNSVQHRFISGRLQAICATVAFGMGIDKSNIRWVVHNNMPGNIESYYQEIGRAGRDGMPAKALMFYSYRDVITHRRFADESGREKVNKAKLDQMIAYAESTVCRRRILLNYFNEPSLCNCGNCDVCQNPPVKFDATILVQKALSAILRASQRATLLQTIDILRGTTSPEVTRNHWNEIKTFGAGAETDADTWRAYLGQMMQMGFIEIDIEHYGRLRVTPMGADILARRERVELSRYIPPVRGRKASRRAKPQPVNLSPDELLLSILKKVRTEVATRDGVPPYIVFSDASLASMVEIKPTDVKAFATVHGVGERKTVKYWRPFVSAIRKHLGLTAQAPSGTADSLTLMLQQQGLTPAEIAKERGVSLTTIYKQLTVMLDDNRITDVSHLIDRATYLHIMDTYRHDPEGFYATLAAEGLTAGLPRMAIAISDWLLRQKVKS